MFLFLFVGSSLFLLFFLSHYMFVFLLLEMMLLSLYMVYILGGLSGSGVHGLFVFLLLIVCMGGFGISMVVYMSRFFGRDFWLLKFVF